MKTECKLPPVFIFIGIAGVGKSTIIRRLAKNHTLNAKQIVTTTTREPRPGEQNGVDYNFIDKKSFQKLIDQKEIFEYKSFNDNFYGTTKHQWTNPDCKALLVATEPEGAIFIKQSLKNRVFIVQIILSDSNELLKRLGSRKMSEEQLNSRIQSDKIQLEMFLASKITPDLVIDNKFLDQSIQKIAQFIQEQII